MTAIAATWVGRGDDGAQRDAAGQENAGVSAWATTVTATMVSSTTSVPYRRNGPELGPESRSEPAERGPLEQRGNEEEEQGVGLELHPGQPRHEHQGKSGEDQEHGVRHPSRGATRRSAAETASMMTTSSTPCMLYPASVAEGENRSLRSVLGAQIGNRVRTEERHQQHGRPLVIEKWCIPRGRWPNRRGPRPASAWGRAGLPSRPRASPP